ncbi:MAG: HEPN domain-containing protein [Campylobacterales bacterium]|nr:HEPN domain-containing protein [Campylobacterales bacterium]
MNETSAKEWLTKSWHHLSSAQLLYKAEHYTDVIAIDLHYTVEIMLKSFLAYQNKQIYKTHNLIELHSHIVEYINFDENDKDLLRLITTYHIKESYPNPHRRLPSREEIKQVLDFAENLLVRVCTLLGISIEEIKVG